MINSTEGVHVTTHPKGTGWVSQSNGVVLSSHRDKNVAIEKGRRIAKRHRTQLTIHRRDGTVVQTQSYSAAPVV
jgi:hypothetical protein